jgi:hypothetical protein
MTAALQPKALLPLLILLLLLLPGVLAPINSHCSFTPFLLFRASHSFLRHQPIST